MFTAIIRKWFSARNMMPGEVKPCTTIIRAVSGYSVQTPNSHSERLSLLTSAHAAVQQRARWVNCVATSARDRRMKGRWLPLPMAVLSHPQKWSNSSTQASVRWQYFVRGPFTTHVVVQTREKSADLTSLRTARRWSSTPELLFLLTGTFPGSDNMTVKNRPIDRGTPSSNISASVGAMVQLTVRMSVRYWKSARDTQTSQHVAAPLYTAICLYSSICFSLGSGFFRLSCPVRLPASGSAAPTAKSNIELLSRSLSIILCMALSLFSLARSRTVRPLSSVAPGSTCLSRRNSRTSPLDACTARCSAVILVPSTTLMSVSK
mmetsp:Transcript_67988/g.178286  ORF Transcript_67988/g.178286 Transcript_67988/m.178286 type:complete len:320 (+) Transcript_67988:273-1232(+)